MKEEIIMKLGCEGYGNEYYRVTNDDGSVYYTYSLSDSFDDDEDFYDKDHKRPVPKKFDTFEEAFEDLKKNTGWYKLYFYDLHEDYRDYIKAEKRKAMSRNQDSPD